MIVYMYNNIDNYMAIIAILFYENSCYNYDSMLMHLVFELDQVILALKFIWTNFVSLYHLLMYTVVRTTRA
jgi:hypothetical protein